MAAASPADLRGVQQLSTQLRNTLEHFVEVVYKSSPLLQKSVSSHEQEIAIAALLLLVLEGRAVARYDATLAEALCGLQRKRMTRNKKFAFVLLLVYQRLFPLLPMIMGPSFGTSSEIVMKISQQVLPAYAYQQSQRLSRLLRTATRVVSLLLVDPTSHELIKLFQSSKPLNLAYEDTRRRHAKLPYMQQRKEATIPLC
ncbi:hypothetical protein L7F22_030842 [Adiantum nelumboides]|nr:hypothetical protein [Adiantum nelumboides]